MEKIKLATVEKSSDSEWWSQAQREEETPQRALGAWGKRSKNRTREEWTARKADKGMCDQFFCTLYSVSIIKIL